MKAWRANQHDGQAYFETQELYDHECDLPCPEDPEVFVAMVQRGQLIAAGIMIFCVTVLPAVFIAVGFAAFAAFGIPVCGRIGQLEVLTDPMRCGTKISWEFYLGVSVLVLGFLVSSTQLPNIKAAAGWKRLKKLRQRLAASGSEKA